MISQRDLQPMFRAHRVLGLLILLANVAMTNSVVAQYGFRVETDVFTQAGGEPVSQTVTLFQDGIAYDRSREPGQDITMVDVTRGRIVRMSEAHKIKTETQIDSLKQLLEIASKQASQFPNLALHVMAARKVDVQPERVTIGGEPVLYEATLQKPSDEPFAKAAASEYRKFADASKLLNSFSGGGDPPFVRLALNEAIFAQTAIPKEITVVVDNGTDKEKKLTCKLFATWKLSQEDRDKITEFKEMLVTFQDVTNEQYNQQTRVGRVASR